MKFLHPRQPGGQQAPPQAMILGEMDVPLLPPPGDRVAGMHHSPVIAPVEWSPSGPTDDVITPQALV
eukprot:8408566-Prorocentrum_lima.AAC.1